MFVFLGLENSEDNLFNLDLDENNRIDKNINNLNSKQKVSII